MGSVTSRKYLATYRWHDNFVFTSGAFDLLHAGHVDLLERAAKLIPWPHILIVGINSDESIRKYKPHKIINRPIIPLQQRMKIVAALECVTYVFPFDEPNNNKNIKVLRPSIYVKGGDYTKEDLSSTPLVERYGGEVIILPFTENVSTSQIVTNIIEGANKLPALIHPRDLNETRTIRNSDGEGEDPA